MVAYFNTYSSFLDSQLLIKEKDMEKYTLDPVEVRKIMDLKSSGMKYNEEQFRYYHLNRNHFNVKNDIGFLRAIGNNKFIDIQKNIWEEQPVEKNLFHMTFKEMLISEKPRKFLRDDHTTLGGEFEIVIRKNKIRITGDISCRLQETYNFGRTRDTAKHMALDVWPHVFDGMLFCNYESYGKMDDIHIFDLPQK